MIKAVEIFIAYSRKDTVLMEEFRVHLKPLERTGRVKIWYDGLIEPGAVWEDAIKQHLHASDIILLLVSSDAIASDYFYEKEVADALARHHRGEARVVPLIMRHCAWETTPLADLQALPKDGRPVIDWPNRDAAYADAVKSLWTTTLQIEQHRTKAATQPPAQKKAEAAAQLVEKERLQREEEAERRQKQEAEARKAAQLAKEAEARRREAEAQLAEKERQQREAIAERQRREQEQRQKEEKAEALRVAQRNKEAEARRRAEQPNPPYSRWAAMAGGALLVVFLLARLLGGGGDEVATNNAYADALKKAETVGTLPAWEEFLKAYPDSVDSNVAQGRVDSLKALFDNLVNDSDVFFSIGSDADGCDNLRHALLILPNDPDILQRINKAGC